MDTGISSVVNLVTADYASFKSTVTDQQEYVTGTVTSFTTSMQQMSDKLQQRTEDVDHFLSAELQQDVPTGSI